VPDGSEMQEGRLDEVDEFLRFLRTFRDEGGGLKYKNRLEQIVASGSRSLFIDFDDLLGFNRELGSRIVKNPRELLPELEKHCRPELAAIDPTYASRLRRFNIRISGLPERTSLRTIRSEHLNTMVSIEGIVVRSTPIKSLLLVGRFACKRCGTKQDFPQSGELLRHPALCTDPSCGAKGSSAFELLEAESEFVDIQELRLQERPEDLPPGQLPRTADVYVFDDMVDAARPGDRTTLTGIVVGEPEAHPTGGKYRTFVLRLHCNYLEVPGLEEEVVTITSEEEQQMLKMSKDPWIFKKLVSSLAPSIYGLEDEKEAIILQLMGGNVKELPDGVRIRGDLNVFLIGDPGTAKSQLLKYVQKIAPRGLYTSGRGSTAAGLTATAVRERYGGYVLEAGALVLADRGIAAIDEFEKMRPEDRIAIHEAMEQQSYHPSVEILLADGRKVKIGAYVDDLFGRYETRKVRGINCEILTPPVSDEIYAMELASGSLQRTRIDRVSRHIPPETFVSITYSNGRRILVTPEHPVYVLREGHISTVPAMRVREGDFVPAPRKTVGNLAPSLSLPLKDPREKEVALPTQLTERIAAILGYLMSEGCFYRGSSREINFTNKDPFILNEMKALMSEVFEIGYTPDSSSYGIPSQRYTSSRLYKWFMLNFPEMVRRSRWRRAPAKVLSSPLPCVRAFLRTAFLGDGSVESEAFCYRTASRGLAEDYQDLLLRLGIASRIVRDKEGDAFKTYIAGDSISRFRDEIVDLNDSRIQEISLMVHRSRIINRHHDVVPTSFVRLIDETSAKLGLINNGYFNEHIEGGFGVTVDVANRFLHRLINRFDEIEGRDRAAPSLRELRSAINWSQPQLASAMLVKRGTIDYCERGGYDEEARSELIRGAKAAIRSNLADARRNILRLAEVLKSNIRALRVRKVELVPNHGKYKVDWVYDVTVEPQHNFISQGVLLHNTCSVAKGGIVATLNARTAILAAANPALGRYDSNKLFIENANLPPTILSRFDLIFVLKDIPDEDSDRRLSEHILNYHRGGLSTGPDVIDQSTLRKYLSYCRKLRPRLTQDSSDRLNDFFLEMRRQSSVGGAPMAITPRQLESLVRLSEARAKAHVRNEVSVEDAEAAIALMKRSLAQAGMDVETGQIDVDAFLTGKPKSTRDRMGKILELVAQLEDQSGSANLDELENLAEKQGMQKTDFGSLIAAMLREGLLYSPDEQSVKRAMRR
jgi:replicative DNA helicase Mcm